MKTVRGGRGAE
ncbi:hypothetical protein KGM_213186A, partial [Danaus plexippus plexippus]